MIAEKQSITVYVLDHETPDTITTSYGRCSDWLPARGFHHGPERLRSTKRPEIRLQSDLPQLRTYVAPAAKSGSGTSAKEENPSVSA